MDDRTPSWGIEPVPERLRVLGFVDLFLLWSSLSVSLLVIVAGAVLVDGDFGLGLSLQSALVAIVAAALVGNLLLGIAGAIGADARVPGMVVLRAPLGQRGSYLPTFLNVVQNLGWSIFELLIIATAAAALSDRVLGFHARWLWTLLFGGISVALALLGPIGFVRRYVRKFAIWVVLASLLYLTWWVLDRSSLSEFWHGHGHGGSAWAGFDLVLASIISWTPLAADYTRFGRNRRSAFWGTGLGYFVPDDLDVRARRAAAALAEHQRRGRDPRGGGDRRRPERDRPARADGRRDRRGVRGHLLDRGLDPERLPAPPAAAPDRSRRRDGDRRARWCSTSRTTRRFCSCSARSSCRCSAS